MKSIRIVAKYLKYLPFLLIGLIPLIWFWGKPGILINGLDTNFPLDPLVWLRARFYVWNDTYNAGSDFSSGVGGMFFHLIQAIPFLMGASLQLTEIISITFWFSAVVISAWFFARTFIPKSYAAQIIFVALYSLNIYLYNTWENIKVANLALVVSLPLLIACLHAYKKSLINTKYLFLFLVIGSVFASGSVINPAYFLVILICIAIYFVISVSLARFRGSEFKKLFIVTALSFLFLFLINAFSIIPLAKNLFLTERITDVATYRFDNWINSLSKDTSLFNILRLQGAWDWYAVDDYGMPLYIPYALNYFKHPIFIIFSLVVFILAIFSLVLRKKEDGDVYSFFGILFVIGTFLGVGTHPPTGSLYSLVVETFPVLTFFRSPWYIFTPLLVLALSGLTALLVRRLEMLPKVRFLIWFGVIVFIIGHLFYSYPLVTGKIFRPGRQDSFYINFPDYVWETRDWLKQAPKTDMRIITYPDNQLENFAWGYRGTESILGLFSEREIINPSFRYPNREIEALIDQFYLHIRAEQFDSAISLLSFLGVDTIFDKLDSVSLSPSIDYENLVIKDKMSVNKIGEWVFIKTNESSRARIGRIFSPEEYYLNYSSAESFAAVSSILNSKSLIGNFGDSEVGKLPKFEEKSLGLIEAINISLENNPTSSIQEFSVEVRKDSDYRFLLERWGIGSADDIFIEIDSNGFQKLPISITDSLYIIGPVLITKGNHTIRVEIGSSENLLRESRPKQMEGIDELRFEELPPDLNKTLVLYNSSEENIEMAIPVNGFDPFSDYVFKLDHKYFYGRSPIATLLQSAPTAPIKKVAKDTQISYDWDEMRINFESVPAPSKLEVFLTMTPTRFGKGKSYIENLSLERVVDNKLFLLENGTSTLFGKADISYEKVSPVEYRVVVEDTPSGYFLVFLENYSPDWTISSDVLLGDPIHFKANGYANGWYIPRVLGNHELIIYYRPQRLFTLGLLLSGVAIGVSVLIILLGTKIIKL